MSWIFEIIQTRLDHLEDLLENLGSTLKVLKAPENPDKLLTVKEAADFLNLKPQTVYSKVSRNELPVMKRGKHLHFSSVELLKYLKQGRKKTICEIENQATNYFSSTKK